MKKRFSHRDLTSFRKLLVERRHKLAGTYEHFSRDALNGVSKRDGDLSTLPSELADASSQMFDQALALDLMANEADAIGKIDQALGRIKGGKYGDCEFCGKPIPLARLKALPSATLCVRCREQEERGGLEYEE
jgi:DnaK suppressor protein